MVVPICRLVVVLVWVCRSLQLGLILGRMLALVVMLIRLRRCRRLESLLTILSSPIVVIMMVSIIVVGTIVIDKEVRITISIECVVVVVEPKIIG